MLPRKGDWKCNFCDGWVFSRKLQCKCGQRRYQHSAGYMKMMNELGPDFLICVKCNTRRQKDVEVCFNCKKENN